MRKFVKKNECKVDELDCGDWLFYLEKKLKFPFDAEMCFHSYSKYLKDGDILSVKEIDDCFDLYGIIATAKHGRKKYNIAFVEMTVVDKKSKNYSLIEAYKNTF